VLLDTPPLLNSSDSTILFPRVDGVLLVARSGRTSSAEAEQAAAVLARLGAPVVGVALNESATAIGGSKLRRFVLRLRPATRGIPRLVRHSGGS